MQVATNTSEMRTSKASLLGRMARRAIGNVTGDATPSPSFWCGQSTRTHSFSHFDAGLPGTFTVMGNEMKVAS